MALIWPPLAQDHSGLRPDARVTGETLSLQELVLSVKGLPRLARFLPKVVLALLVSASAEGYKKLAIWLNDMGTPCKGRACHSGEEGPYCPSGPPLPSGGLGCLLTHPLGPQRITGWRAPMRSTSLSKSSW